MSRRDRGSYNHGGNCWSPETHFIQNNLSQLNISTQLRRLVRRQEGEAVEQLCTLQTPFLHQELNKVMPTIKGTAISFSCLKKNQFLWSKVTNGVWRITFCCDRWWWKPNLGISGAKMLPSKIDHRSLWSANNMIKKNVIRFDELCIEEMEEFFNLTTCVVEHISSKNDFRMQSEDRSFKYTPRHSHNLHWIKA